MSGLTRLHDWLLRILLPRAFYRRHGHEIRNTFSDLLANTRPQGGNALLRLLQREITSALRVSWQEWRRSRSGVPRIPAMWRDSSNDVKYATRLLVRAPQFTVIVVLTLAAGIGGNAAVFTVVNGVFMRPLPYPRADELVQIWNLQQDPQHERMTVAPADFLDWRSEARSFRDIAAHNLWYPTLSHGADAERVLAELVTPNLLPLLGVQPALGRQFTGDEGHTSNRHVALLSWGAWQRRFAGAPSVIGRDLKLNGELYEIVGVLPQTYRHPDPHRPLEEPEVLVPINFSAANADRASQFLRVVGRLQPTATIAAARAELTGIADRLEAAYPASNRGRGVNIVPLRENFFGSLLQPFAAALIAAGLVLLIACANIANLVLVRSQGRRREFALRSALGASRGRLMRQLVIESGLVSVLGGALGLLPVLLGSAPLRAVQSRFVPVIADVRVDANVIVFTAATCLLTALLFGLAPLLELRRNRIRQTLSEESAGSGGSRQTQRIRAALVITEVALSVALVIATGLLARTFLAVRATPLGFTPDNALVLEVVAPRTRYPTGAQSIAFMAELTRRLQELPGVDTLGMVSDLPLSTGNTFSGMLPDIAGADALPRMTEFVLVTPGYLEAMRIPLRAGRVYVPQDMALTAMERVVISESLARTFWPGQSPLGRRIVDKENDGRSYTVLGVVGDVLDDRLTGQPDPTVYMLSTLQPQRRMHAVIRTSGDPSLLIPAVRRTARELDPEVAVVNIRPLRDIVSLKMEPQRFAAVFATAFAILALALAGLGVYGVVAYSVASRTREIGIRTALGADARKVQRSVLVAAVLLVLPGVVLGVLLGLAQTSVIAGFLYGVPTLDPISFVAATLLLPLIALIAGWIPARRAARIQPTEALRSY
jgi:putative ABC transport system permease protein